MQVFAQTPEGKKLTKQLADTSGQLTRAENRRRELLNEVAIATAVLEETEALEALGEAAADQERAAVVDLQAKLAALDAEIPSIKRALKLVEKREADARGAHRDEAKEVLGQARRELAAKLAAELERPIVINAEIARLEANMRQCGVDLTELGSSLIYPELGYSHTVDTFWQSQWTKTPVITAHSRWLERCAKAGVDVKLEGPAVNGSAGPDEFAYGAAAAAASYQPRLAAAKNLISRLTDFLGSN